MSRVRLLFKGRVGAGPTPQVPVALSEPTISGTPSVGMTLTCQHALYDHGPITSYAYQWERDGVDIPGASSQNYTLVEADEGATITVKEWASNAYGQSVAYVESDPVGPVSPAADGISVGPLYDGTGGSGNPTPPDPAASLAARQLEGAKQQLAVDLMYPPYDDVMLDDLDFMVQVELLDLDASSPTRGLPMACEVDIYFENETPFTLTERTERTIVTPYRGQTKTAYGFWGKLKKPSGFEFVTPNGPGCEARMYIVARPLDDRFDPCAAGPFTFFPRLPEHVVVKELHKTAPVTGPVVREILDVMEAARTEFQTTGRAVVGEVTDTNKGWAPGRLTGVGGTPAGYHDIPWNTWIRPRVTGGVATTWRLGDETNITYPGTASYWEPRLDKIAYAGHSHDIGVTGGIVASNHGIDGITIFDHECYSGGFPASTTIGSTFHPRYGSGAGAASLIFGRLASGAPYRCNEPGKTRIRSYFGDFHDLPAKSIEQHALNFCDTNRDISGSAVGNSYGSMYGVLCERFGGYYSGISTVQNGAANLSIKLMQSGGSSPAYKGWKTTSSCGSSNNRLLIYAGATRAAAMTAGPIFDSGSLDTVRLDTLAAAINADPDCIAAGITAEDNHSGPDLDGTHLWINTMISTSPCDDPSDSGPLNWVGSELQLHCTLDIHANGDAWAVPDVRKGLSRRDCMWLNYCGAGEVAVSTNDEKLVPPTPAGGPLYDIYYVGCAWYNEGGFTDINGNWQPLSGQGGRWIGRLDGCGVSRSVVAQDGKLYDSAEKPKRNCGWGYTFSNIGNVLTADNGMFAHAIVSPTWQYPTGSTVTNFRNLQLTPTVDPEPAGLTFADPANGDFHVINASRVLCQDGVNYAGIYAPDGTNLSRIDY